MLNQKPFLGIIDNGCCLCALRYPHCKRALPHSMRARDDLRLASLIHLGPCRLSLHTCRVRWEEMTYRARLGPAQIVGDEPSALERSKSSHTKYMSDVTVSSPSTYLSVFVRCYLFFPFFSICTQLHIPMYTAARARRLFCVLHPFISHHGRQVPAK